LIHRLFYARMGGFVTSIKTAGYNVKKQLHEGEESLNLRIFVKIDVYIANQQTFNIHEYCFLFITP